MNIPALCQTPVPIGAAGKMGIVDGFTGQVYIDPDEETLANILRRSAKRNRRSRRLLKELKGKETVTKSGRKVKLYANIGGIGDLNFVLKENDAAGVGLFRSEFLYLPE